MAKFTPGPLKVVENGIGEAVIIRDINNPILGVAACHHHGLNSNKEVMWANAYLYAAAPEMYEALKDALKALTNQYYNKPRRGMEREYRLIKATLDKAEGRRE